MDPITVATALQLGLLVVKALEAGVTIGVRVDALVTNARAEGRDVSPAELNALALETNQLRDERNAALASAVGESSPE